MNSNSKNKKERLEIAGNVTFLAALLQALAWMSWVYIFDLSEYNNSVFYSVLFVSMATVNALVIPCLTIFSVNYRRILAFANIHIFLIAINLYCMLDIFKSTNSAVLIVFPALLYSISLFFYTREIKNNPFSMSNLLKGSEKLIVVAISELIEKEAITKLTMAQFMGGDYLRKTLQIVKGEVNFPMSYEVERAYKTIMELHLNGYDTTKYTNPLVKKDGKLFIQQTGQLVEVSKDYIEALREETC